MCRWWTAVSITNANIRYVPWSFFSFYWKVYTAGTYTAQASDKNVAWRGLKLQIYWRIKQDTQIEEPGENPGISPRNIMEY